MKAKDYFKFGELFGYFFRKHDPNRPTSTSTKMMHWSNRISIVMFLIALGIMIYRYLSR